MHVEHSPRRQREDGGRKDLAVRDHHDDLGRDGPQAIDDGLLANPLGRYELLGRYEHADDVVPYGVVIALMKSVVVS